MFENFLITVLRAEIVTVFELKMVTISTRNTMRKFANSVRLYFPHITTFFNQILEFYFFGKVLSDLQKFNSTPNA